MACNFITDIAENGTKFKLIFETDDKEAFTYMLEAARNCIDHNLPEKKYTENEDIKSVYKHYTANGAIFVTSEPIESEDTE